MQVDPPTRVLVRIAQKLRDRLGVSRAVRLSDLVRRTDSLLESAERVRSARRRLGLCVARGWTAAATKVQNQLRSAVRDGRYYASQIQQAEEAGLPDVPALREFLADIQQLKEEFGHVQYAGKSQTLSVITEAIELEHVYLGEFEIRLHLNRLGESQRGTAYSIVALDPRPAASNNAVTHPHVSDGELCAGDASAAIRAALDAGRITDVFQLVHSVLTTYNPDSPYISLDKWDGAPCYDCGYTMASDDTCWCSICADSFCPACMASCDEYCEPLCKSCAEALACSCYDDQEETLSDEQEDQERPGTIESEDFDVFREAARATAHTVGVDPA